MGECEGGLIWENGIETYILSFIYKRYIYRRFIYIYIYKRLYINIYISKRIASPGSMHNTGCLGLVHWDDPEGWDREGSSGWETHVHPWRIHVDVWQTNIIL